MDKVHMLNTLTTLHAELTKRLDDEEQSNKNSERITEYKRQLLQIKNEIDRINRGRYSRTHKAN